MASSRLPGDIYDGWLLFQIGVTPSMLFRCHLDIGWCFNNSRHQCGNSPGESWWRCSADRLVGLRLNMRAGACERSIFLQNFVCICMVLSVFKHVCHNKSLENMSELILRSRVHHCLTNGGASSPNDGSRTTSLVYQIIIWRSQSFITGIASPVADITFIYYCSCCANCIFFLKWEMSRLDDWHWLGQSILSIICVTAETKKNIYIYAIGWILRKKTKHSIFYLGHKVFMTLL